MRILKIGFLLVFAVIAVWWFAASPASELRISGPLSFTQTTLVDAASVDQSTAFRTALQRSENGLPAFDDIIFMADGKTALVTGTDGKIWSLNLEKNHAEPLADVPLMPAGMHKTNDGQNAYFCASYMYGETYPEGERVGLYYFDTATNTVTPVVLNVPDTAITPGVGKVYADADKSAPTLAGELATSLDSEHVTAAGGRALAFCNDLEISQDGQRIYITEPFSYGHAAMGGGTVGEAVTLANNGRLWRHDLTTGKTRLVAEGFNFIDGILYDLHPGMLREQSLLVSQTPSFKLTRFFLRGPKAGMSESVIEGLPGMSDGLDRDENGVIWSGLIKMRSPSSDWVHANPWIKPLLLRLPEAMMPVTRETGILALSADGSRLLYFARYEGPLLSSIASALPGPKGLYIAAVGEGQSGLTILPWPDGFAPQPAGGE